MKKFLLALIMILATLSAVYADGFTTVSVPCPEGESLWAEDYQAYSRLLMRYADDKTPIPLSKFVDGYMFATIPKENKDRPVEAFVSEEKSFADDNESYEIHIMKSVSARGIIKGDGQGNANPNDNITRAEATAMILRLLGLSESETADSGFTDVKETDWHAKTIAAAKKYGIVKGDSETTFSPNRLVSREELVVMIARAAYSSGLQIETEATAEQLKEICLLADAEEISYWARSAYKTMRTFCVSDTVYTDELHPDGGYVSEFYANPQKNALRFDAAMMIFRLCDNYLNYPTQVAIKYGFDKEMPVIDGSTSTYPYTQAVYRNLFSAGLYHPSKPESHSKSHASYQRLINGEVDMLFASVYPASDILEMAKEKGIELELIPIAYDAMIFFTNAQNSTEGLTKEQISNIYVNDAYENWSELGGEDALLYPYCRNNDSGSHAQMERHFLNGNEINEKIRQETTSVTMANVLTDVMNAKTDNPKGFGLGYSIYYYFNNMDPFYNTKTELKLLSVDGVYPTDETIANGSYPLSNNTYIVLRSDEEENSPARRMAEFMLSEKGQECVIEAGYGPLKK